MSRPAAPGSKRWERRALKRYRQAIRMGVRELSGPGVPGRAFCGLCGWDVEDARCVNLWCDRGPLREVEVRLMELAGEVSVGLGMNGGDL